MEKTQEPLARGWMCLWWVREVGTGKCSFFLRILWDEDSACQKLSSPLHPNIATCNSQSPAGWCWIWTLNLCFSNLWFSLKTCENWHLGKTPETVSVAVLLPLLSSEFIFCEKKILINTFKYLFCRCVCYLFLLSGFFQSLQKWDKLICLVNNLFCQSFLEPVKCLGCFKSITPKSVHLSFILVCTRKCLQRMPGQWDMGFQDKLLSVRAYSGWQGLYFSLHSSQWHFSA